MTLSERSGREYPFSSKGLWHCPEADGLFRDEPSISWCSVMNDEYTGRPLLGAILEEKFGLLEAKLLEAINIQADQGGASRRNLDPTQGDYRRSTPPGACHSI